jgi:general secretion pathway protein I
MSPAARTASRAPSRRRSRSGFTLLEVVIAIAILGTALMAIFDLNAGAISMHGYTKRVTVASLLARSKMTDIEQELIDDGFGLDDREMSGDFREEGWEGFKWRARVIAPRTSGVSPQQFMGALFNLPIGGEGGDDPLAALGSKLGGSQPGGPQPGPNPMTGGMGGMAAGLMTTQFNQMLEQIRQQVREVQLTVTWKDGTQTETFDLVTHVVSTGKGSDRNPPAPGTIR